ncbi:unnamed protein product [Ceutorhynchus assimilis]|uniref:Nucleoporin Nup43 n=1 Tax=Ceutorhynchus assimilis TaxID=467358 RepID=A0A9N9QR40_9CUCU|nr:unnamed protein product [Ceutorhynchus assimilis]
MFSDHGSTVESTTSFHNLNGIFVSQKVNKIRWKPETFGEPHFFLTGSWDDESNKIVLWDIVENAEEEDFYPFSVAEYPYCGDVTEMKFLNTEYFACSSSSGSANVMRVSLSEIGEPLIQNYTTWENLHYFKNGDPSPCTALAVHDNDMATVGEDGRINILRAQSKDIVRRIDNADSCSINCVIYLNHNEILTSNLRGQMKSWDLRSDTKQPKSSFMLSGDLVTPTQLTYHPSQRYIIIAGDELGALTSWDLRQNTYPVNVLNAHEGAISEIQFHPDHLDHLFSCSRGGEIWHWSTKTKNKYGLEHENINAWLAPDDIKAKLEVLNLMPTLKKPINTLDLSNNRVICGGDNEAIYLINGITF